MKQLTNKQHLVYQLTNSHLVTSLPFIDQELDNQIPKSKVSYLIAAQQKLMQKNSLQYIKDLKEPALSYIGSQDFERQVERVQAKMQQKQKQKGDKDKKKDVIFPLIPKKVATKDLPKMYEKVNQGIIGFQHFSIKNTNLELYKKFGPLIMKQLIEILDKQKAALQQSISKEQQAIDTLNKNRKYEQTQTYQREYDIGQRIKIMLNKRRKVD